jgi:ankyrin repeat protein
MRALLAAGADPHQEADAKYGTTLLMRAAACGYLETAYVLLEAGVDPNAAARTKGYFAITEPKTGGMRAFPFQPGLRAIDLALYFERQAIVALLERYGAHYDD